MGLVGVLGDPLHDFHVHNHINVHSPVELRQSTGAKPRDESRNQVLDVQLTGTDRGRISVGAQLHAYGEVRWLEC